MLEKICIYMQIWSRNHTNTATMNKKWLSKKNFYLKRTSTVPTNKCTHKHVCYMCMWGLVSIIWNDIGNWLTNDEITNNFRDISLSLSLSLCLVIIVWKWTCQVENWVLYVIVTCKTHSRTSVSHLLLQLLLSDHQETLPGTWGRYNRTSINGHSIQWTPTIKCTTQMHRLAIRKMWQLL